MIRKQPRGIRNNNPGNIDRTAEKWQGMSADQSSDPRFVVFDAPEWGIRALARVLRNYGRKHGLRTIRSVINRWAPPVENNTAAYVSQIAKKIGLDPDQTIDLEDAATLEALTVEIIQHENGIQPYTPDQIREGVRRALL